MSMEHLRSDLVFEATKHLDEHVAKIVADAPPLSQRVLDDLRDLGLAEYLARRTKAAA